MKTTKQILKLFILISFIYSGKSDVLASDNSIVVTNPQISNLSVPPSAVSKMMRVEITKLNRFTVFDEFDTQTFFKQPDTKSDSCQSVNCMVLLGQSLKAGWVLSGSIDKLGDRVIIQLKLVNVQEQRIVKNGIEEYIDQMEHLQRMIEFSIKKIFEEPVAEEPRARLLYANQLVTPNSVGKINNSGPRVGYAIVSGDLAEFLTRDTKSGGVGAIPAMSMLGYQFEAAYSGNENFSALVEFIVNVNGLEHGLFVPSATLLNGFRLEKSGLEIAFGPSFTLKKVRNGFIDREGQYGRKGQFFNESDWYDYQYALNGNDSSYYQNGTFEAPRVEEVSDQRYSFDDKILHSEGDVMLQTQFVVAIGKTVRAGGLNIPINVFYSMQPKSSMFGLSVGFNIQTNKSAVNSYL